MCNGSANQITAFALSGLHTANLSWQTLVGKLQKVGKPVPSHDKLVANNEDGNFQHGRFLVRFQSRTTVKQRIRREEPESGRELETFGRNPVFPRVPLFGGFCLFLAGIFVGYR